MSEYGCDKDSDISTATQNGGNILEIISVKDDVVRFTLQKPRLHRKTELRE